ncbi:HsdM family class I SAM-dependent methyltransferase [Candidatus Avelusimicrobium sp.]
MKFKTEDEVREEVKKVLGFKNDKRVKSGVGQLTTFNKLGFKGIIDRPDGWYLPNDNYETAIIVEAKNSNENVTNKKWIREIQKNITITKSKYKNVIGIIYNGYDVNVFLNNSHVETVNELQNKEYYLGLIQEHKIDKQEIYNLTKKINDSLHFDFGIMNLYHRMIFTACALVSERYEGNLTKVKGLGYSTFHTSILNTLSKSLTEAKKQNQKLDILLEVYSEIKMNITENQEAIDDFIDNVVKISKSINSDNWNGEDVMAIFFNEFNRYKKKSDRGQVFTPDNITSFMYRLININQNDVVLDAACGSGAFLVKSMCNMIKEAGGIRTKKAAEIKSKQLYGIELSREIFALACANMLIHKDGKTNLEQNDTRTSSACSWIASKPITKVLMNPPFERKYGCMTIVANVLNSIPVNTDCAFILPDKKLEKEIGRTKKILKKHRLCKIIKLPEKTFTSTTTSIFVFKSGLPQDNKEIFGCYVEDDGLETVKNQGRHDVKNKWQSIEDYWIDSISKLKDEKYHTAQWIKPREHLSYQMPEKPFEIFEEDFRKTAMDYLMFKKGINVKEFGERLINSTMYSSSIEDKRNKICISLNKENANE